MNFKRSVVVACLILAPISSAQSCNALESLAWMLGKWRSESKRAFVIEEWVMAGASKMQGRGAFYDPDTQQLKSQESLALISMNQHIYYLAKPEHQPMPVPFELTECGKERALFANPTHDFPTSIEYQINARRELEVMVGAGQPQSFQLIFTRMAD